MYKSILLALAIAVIPLSACDAESPTVVESQSFTVGSQTRSITRIGNRVCATKIDSFLGTMSTSCK